MTKALAGILGGIAPGVQQTYDNASTAQAAFAKGFSDQMQAAQAQRADNVGSFLQNVVGAPSSQVSQVQGQVNPAGAGDTLYGLRGYIPASTLNEEGAAYTANARQLPAVAAAQGLQQIGRVQSAQQAQDRTFAQQLAEISGKAPEYREKVANDLFNQQYKQSMLDATKTRLAQGQERLDLTAKMEAFNEKYKINQQKISIARLNQAAEKFAFQQVQSDRNYRIALQNLGLRKAAAQRAATAQEYKLANGGFTPLQVNKFKTSAYNIAHVAYTGAPKRDKNGAPVYDAKGNPVILPAVDYKTAIKEMRSAGVPLSIAIPQLNQVYKPGERGRPFDEASSPAIVGPGLGDRNNKIVQTASSMLGTPYVWGGNSPGKALDCSGFIQQTYARLGVKLPRTTYAQVKVGQPVTLQQLQPGDAIFTEPGKNGPNHVGLYIGNGMVQESPHTGDVNKVIPLSAFLSGGFVAARRYVNVSG